MVTERETETKSVQMLRGTSLNSNKNATHKKRVVT